MRFFVAAIMAAELGSTLALPTRLPSEMSGLESTALTRRNIDIAALLSGVGLGQANAREQQESAQAETAKKIAAQEEAVAAEGAQEAAAKNEAALKTNEEAVKLEQEAASKAKEEAAKVAEEAARKEAEAAEGKAEVAAPVEGEVKAGEGAEEKAAAGEEEEGGEDLVGAFDVATELQGGDLKQDVLFTKSAVGAFEFEFQGAAADTLTVSENKTPAAPPAGFVAIEPSSFKVALAASKGVGLTLAKIDYVFDPASALTAGVDLTQAKVGKLCADVGAFVIEETLGEVEFEAEENEVTLNLNKAVVAEGEWGIFVPAAAVTGAFTATLKAGTGGAAAGNATAVAPVAEQKAGEGAAGEEAKLAEDQKLAEEAKKATEEQKLAEEAKLAKEAAGKQKIAEPAAGEAKVHENGKE